MTERVSQDLIRRAKNNLKSAFLNLSEGLYEECSEMSHNATEKAVKAILENYSVEYGYIHLIDRLAREALPKVPELQTVIDQLDSLDFDYMPSRYTHKHSVTNEDAERDYQIAQKVCEISFKHFGLRE